MANLENQEFNLDYKKTFNHEDHLLTVDLMVRNNLETEHSAYLESYFVSDASTVALPDLTQRTNMEVQNDQWNAKVDYQRPLRENEKLEAGLQSSYRSLSNDYLVETLQNTEWQVFENLDNAYQYDERIQAAYVMYANEIKQLSFQVGTRLEHATIKTSTPSFRKNLQLFPSAHLTYEFSEESALQLSYSRRVWRPRFRSLNPLPTLNNSRSRFQGNPDLRPEFTSMYELGYLKYWEHGTLTASLFYRHTEDVIEGVIFQVIFADPHLITYRKPENLAVKNDIGFELNYSFTYQDWLKLNGNAFFYRAKTDGSALNAEYVSDTYTTRGKLTARLSLSKRTDAQFRFGYRAPFDRPQGGRRSQAYLDFSMSQKVFGKKGTLTFNVFDVFNSRVSRGLTFTDTFFEEDDFRWSRRRYRLTLAYRLGR